MLGWLSVLGIIGITTLGIRKGVALGVSEFCGIGVERIDGVVPSALRDRAAQGDIISVCRACQTGNARARGNRPDASIRCFGAAEVTDVAKDRYGKERDGKYWSMVAELVINGQLV